MISSTRRAPPSIVNIYSYIIPRARIHFNRFHFFYIVFILYSYFIGRVPFGICRFFVENALRLSAFVGFVTKQQHLPWRFSEIILTIFDDYDIMTVRSQVILYEYKNVWTFHEEI